MNHSISNPNDKSIHVPTNKTPYQDISLQKSFFYHGNSMKVFLFGSRDDGDSGRKAIIMFHGKLVNNDTVCTCTRVLTTRKEGSV